MSARMTKPHKTETARRWGGGALLRLLVVGLVFGSVGFGYVAVKNQQARYGKQKEKLKQALLEAREEIRLADGRIAILLERKRLEERLARAGSSLRPISSGEIIELVVEGEVSEQASDVVHEAEEVRR